MPSSALASDNCRPRWWVLLTASFTLSAAASALLRLRPEWTTLALPDPVFLLAFAAALRCHGREFPVFLVCGLSHDLWLGGRLGGHTLLYAAAAALMTLWRRRGGLPDVPGPWWWAGVFGIVVLLPRPLVAWAVWPDGWACWLQAALAVVWTAALFPLFDWWLDTPLWRPWHGRAAIDNRAFRADNGA